MSVFRNVAKLMERIAPLKLAESWDNVGLLLEPAIQRRNANQLLLTIDLTPSVLQEALETPTCMIISYHPPIFKPLKALTLDNSLQSSLLSCAANGIAIYSPHTALDSVQGGVNDWLASSIHTSADEASVNFVGESKDALKAGVGRQVQFTNSTVSFGDLVSRVKLALKLPSVQVAYPELQSASSIINSVGICAGSGGSVLAGCDADVYWTGEMSHHEVLAATAAGKFVILCGHTNTERGYLPVLATAIATMLADDVSTKPLSVRVSERDKHPLAIV